MICIPKPHLLVTVFIGTVVMTLSALTSGGEARELVRPDPCAHVDWPMIPPACLSGGGAKTVRYVFADDSHDPAMASRFTSDFE